MDLFLITAIIFSIVCAVLGIVGAKRSKEGVVGVVANLSIPAFVLTFMAAWAAPQQPGLTASDILMLLVVLAMAIVAAVSNHCHNKLLTEKQVKHHVDK